MTGPKYTYEQLIEKIVTAKLALHASIRSHNRNCITELDPEGYAPCSCGAADQNATINKALAALKLD